MPEADMNREDIIRMAREALKEDDGEDYYAYTHQIPHWWGKEDEIVKFAELVAAAERNRTWTQDHWTEYERSIAAAEREACAKTVMEYDLLYIGSYPINEQYADAIRARGQE
jgi:hypothetical protein